MIVDGETARKKREIGRTEKIGEEIERKRKEEKREKEEVEEKKGEEVEEENASKK